MNNVTIIGLDAGGIYVDNELSKYLYEQLSTEIDFREQKMGYLQNIVDDGLKNFRDYGKQVFSSPTDSLNLDIGGRRMNYPRLQINKGIMTIDACACFILCQIGIG